MPSLESEIEMLEVFSGADVIGITINHEEMDDGEIESTIAEYEEKFGLPTTDVLKKDCSKLIEKLYEVFPDLINIKPLLCQPQD